MYIFINVNQSWNNSDHSNIRAEQNGFGLPFPPGAELAWGCRLYWCFIGRSFS